MFRRAFAPSLAVLLLTLCWACSSTPTRTPAPAAASAPATNQPIAPTSGPLPDETPPEDGAGSAGETPTEEPETADLRASDPTLITIGEPAVVVRPTTLAEASERALEQRRKRAQGSPTAGLMITNENLSEFAAEGQVTFSPGSTGAGPSASSTDRLDETREEYWRERVLEIRTAWAEAHQRIQTLEEETSSLRWRFYAEDDGFFRDERIKPEWDRALDELRRARQEAVKQQDLLAEVLDEGRRAGALPGWLREGVELEPEPEEEVDPQPRRQDPIPPPIYNESGSRPDSGRPNFR